MRLITTNPILIAWQTATQKERDDAVKVLRREYQDKIPAVEGEKGKTTRKAGG